MNSAACSYAAIERCRECFWADSISSSPAAAPKHIITLYSQKADLDPQRVARAAAAIALPGSEVSIVSKSAGMLCGKPATFITARTNTPASPVEQEVRMEITQSDTMMYVLFYARPSSEAPSDVALASLTTLCAQ